MRVAVPLTPFADAETVIVPELTLCAPPAELIVAIEVLLELQFTCRVTSMLEPSLNWPVAVKAWPAPRAMEALEGITVMDVSVALVTVRVA